MKMSESISKIAPALLSAQRKIGAAPKGSANPFFKSKYASLATVMEVVKEPLNDSEIVVLQAVGMDDAGRTYVETMLLHSSGEYISDKMLIEMDVLKGQNRLQAQGSGVSYAKRYGLQALLFVPSEDDDANAAGLQHSVQSRQEPAPAERQPTPINKPRATIQPVTTPDSVMSIGALRNYATSVKPKKGNQYLSWSAIVEMACADLMQSEGKSLAELLKPGGLTSIYCAEVQNLLYKLANAA